MSPLNYCAVRGPFTLQPGWCLDWCDAGWPTQKSGSPNQRFSSLQRQKRFLRSLCYENQTIKASNFTQAGPVMLQTQIPFSGPCRHIGVADLAKKEWIKKKKQPHTAVSMIILLYLKAVLSFRMTFPVYLPSDNHHILWGVSTQSQLFCVPT